MRRLDHFFVLHCPAGPPPVKDVRRLVECLPLGDGWRFHRTGSLLIGWLGGPTEIHAPLLLHCGDPSGLPGDLDLIALAAGSPREAARIDGAFAVLAFDPGAGRAALVTDRFGLMPLYIHQGESWCCATSLALVVALHRIAVRIDTTAACEMLVLHMPLGDRTLIEGVHLVPPATVVVLDDSSLKSISYWNWHHLADVAVSPSANGRDVARETYARIEQAVLAAVPANVKKVALPLSGGLDSRMLAAVLSRHGVPVQAYNIDFGHEAAIARSVARTLKLSLRSLPMLPRPAAITEAHEAIDGAYHVNQVWGWEMVRAAAEDGCDVLFDGLAFDTILGAVHNVAGADVATLAGNLEANYADVAEGILARLMGPEPAAAVYAAVRSSLSLLAKDAIEQAGPRASDYFLMTNRVRKYTFGYCLANLHLLPGRFPYVRTALFEHCQRLPLELRKEHNLYRRIYREIFPELAVIPWAKTMLPLDRYAPAEKPRWRLLLEALVRRMSRGRLHLAARGSFDVAFRRRDLRRVFLDVLDHCSDLDMLFPPGTAERAVHGLMTGRAFGGVVQGLFTIEHCLLVCGENWKKCDENRFAVV